MLDTHVDELYRYWLNGLSIRKIANIYNVGRMAVWGAITRKYGKTACSPRHQSLARLVTKEYGDTALAERARGVQGLYRTTNTENNYSKLQTTDLSTYNLVASTSENSQNMTFKLYYFTAKLTTRLLYLTIWNRINRHSLT